MEDLIASGELRLYTMFKSSTLTPFSERAFLIKYVALDVFLVKLMANSLVLLK